MPSAPVVPTRRDRIRAQTLAEIREHGYAQIAEGGPAALSLNGIAKAMGMSGPALYRYVPSRDDLLATLVVESYEDLGDALARAAAEARRRSPEGRVRAVADAYRTWALAAPHRYRLVHGSTYGSGDLDPQRIIPAAQRSMELILTALAELDPTVPGPPVTDPVLRRELSAWGASRSDGESRDPGLLLLGLRAWTRLNGLIALEIEGNFAQMHIDPARLYRAEIDQIIEQRRSG
jgi:AcrR family transcriptional regulator